MIEPPAIPAALIVTRLLEEYALHADHVAFMPLGADVNTAVYQVEAGGAKYFLKLRSGDFNEISVSVPKFLEEHGVEAVIPPLANQSGGLWGWLDDYRMILYPFIGGQDGYEGRLSPSQWQAFGRAMRVIHAAELTREARLHISGETFSEHWRERVRFFQRQVERAGFADPVAAQLAAFMRVHRAEISRLVDRAEQLAGQLASRGLPQVLCHADLHPGNLLLPTTDRSMIYIIDWDNPLYAPRERDLALIGGTYAWRRARDVRRFYRGYLTPEAIPGAETGWQSKVEQQPEIDLDALLYYRYERIVVDIAEFSEQLLTTTAGGEDRTQSYTYFTSAFLPDHELELTFRGDPLA